MLDLQIRWEGVEDLVAVLSQLPPRLRERAIKPAVDKATRLVARAMKAGQKRKRTGMLTASIGTKVKAKLNRPVYGIAGPRRSSSKPAGSPFRLGAKWRRKKDAKRPGQALVIPTRYAHLIEKGHAKGKGRSAARAYPFMRPAVQSTRGAAAAILRHELTRQLTRLSGKAGA